MKLGPGKLLFNRQPSRPVAADDLEHSNEKKFRFYIEALCQTKTRTGDLSLADLAYAQADGKGFLAQAYNPEQTVGHASKAQRKKNILFPTSTKAIMFLTERCRTSLPSTRPSFSNASNP